MSDRLRVVVGTQREDLAIVEAAVQAFTASHDVPADGQQRVADVLLSLCSWVLDNAFAAGPAGELTVDIEMVSGGLRLLIADNGQPIASFGGESGAVPAELAEIAARTSDLRLFNLGGAGKRLSAAMSMPGIEATAADLPADYTGEAPRSSATPEDVTIRDAGPSDAAAISRLLYGTYGLGYPHDDFYDPTWLGQRLSDEEVRSTVALVDGEVIGHHAMLVEDPQGAVESGVAVVHPAFRGLGLVKRLVDHAIRRTTRDGIPAVLSRAVTHHPYSQRAERSLGFHTTGLMLAAAPGPTGTRVALLAAYLCLARDPRAINLPARYEQHLTAAYANAELKILPADAASARMAIPGAPAVATKRQGLTGMQGDAIITVSRWDPAAREGLIDALRLAVRADDKVVFADLDLNTLTTDELNEIVDLLLNYDFFYSGLMLYGQHGHDHLRMQALLTQDVVIDGLVLDSDFTRALSQSVFADIGLMPTPTSLSREMAGDQ